MANFRFIHLVAKRLGFTEQELATFMKLPGFPSKVEKGRILVDDDEIEEFLESFGIAIPSRYLTNPDEESESDEDDEGDE